MNTWAGVTGWSVRRPPASAAWQRPCGPSRSSSSIARDIRETAPDALLANFTNPAGLVTEALTRYAPDVPAVGVCNVGITIEDGHSRASWKSSPAARSIRSRRALNTLGLNHLTWHRGFTVDGEEMWPHVFYAFLEELKKEDRAGMGSPHASIAGDDPQLLSAILLLHRSQDTGAGATGRPRAPKK